MFCDTFDYFMILSSPDDKKLTDSKRKINLYDAIQKLKKANVENFELFKVQARNIVTDTIEKMKSLLDDRIIQNKIQQYVFDLLEYETRLRNLKVNYLLCARYLETQNDDNNTTTVTVKEASQAYQKINLQRIIRTLGGLEIECLIIKTKMFALYMTPIVECMIKLNEISNVDSNLYPWVVKEKFGTVESRYISLNQLFDFIYTIVDSELWGTLSLPKFLKSNHQRVLLFDLFDFLSEYFIKSLQLNDHHFAPTPNASFVSIANSIFANTFDTLLCIYYKTICFYFLLTMHSIKENNADINVPDSVYRFALVKGLQLEVCKFLGFDFILDSSYRKLSIDNVMPFMDKED